MEKSSLVLSFKKEQVFPSPQTTPACDMLKRPRLSGPAPDPVSEAVSKRLRYDPVGAGQPGQIAIRRVCEDLTRERCGPRPPAGIIAGLGYAMEAT